jgi:hypothetical protein
MRADSAVLILQLSCVVRDYAIAFGNVSLSHAYLAMSQEYVSIFVLS